MLTDECSDVVANATDVVTLAPGEIYAREIDTADPRWHIRMTDDTKANLQRRTRQAQWLASVSA